MANDLFLEESAVSIGGKSFKEFVESKTGYRNLSENSLLEYKAGSMARPYEDYASHFISGKEGLKNVEGLRKKADRLGAATAALTSFNEAIPFNPVMAVVKGIVGKEGRDDLKQIKSDHPVSSAVGGVAGNVAGGFSAGGLISKGIFKFFPKFAPAANAVATGIATGLGMTAGTEGIQEGIDAKDQNRDYDVGKVTRNAAINAGSNVLSVPVQHLKNTKPLFKYLGGAVTDAAANAAATGAVDYLETGEVNPENLALSAALGGAMAAGGGYGHYKAETAAGKQTQIPAKPVPDSDFDIPTAILNPKNDVAPAQPKAAETANEQISESGEFPAEAIAALKSEREQIRQSQSERESAASAENAQIDNTLSDYQNSTDDGLVAFAEDIISGIESPAGKNQIIGKVSQKAADNIKELTGVDVSGFRHNLQGERVEHINKDHGAQGITDNSMSDLNDFGRMKYILDNYDEVKLSPDESNRYRNSDGEHSQVLEYKKKVNGNYYIIEAVVDTKAKKLQVITAYKSKAGDRADKRSNAAQGDPQLTSETELSVTPATDNIQNTTVKSQEEIANLPENITIIKDASGNETYVRINDDGSQTQLTPKEFAEYKKRQQPQDETPVPSIPDEPYSQLIERMEKSVPKEETKRGRPKKSVFKFAQEKGDNPQVNEIIKSKFKFVENSQGTYDIFLDENAGKGKPSYKDMGKKITLEEINNIKDDYVASEIETQRQERDTEAEMNKRAAKESQRLADSYKKLSAGLEAQPEMSDKPFIKAGNETYVNIRKMPKIMSENGEYLYVLKKGDGKNIKIPESNLDYYYTLTAPNNEDVFVLYMPRIKADVLNDAVSLDEVTYSTGFLSLPLKYDGLLPVTF